MLYLAYRRRKILNMGVGGGEARLRILGERDKLGGGGGGVGLVVLSLTAL